ncbi:MAG: hypothetical protein IT378_21625 [Sandaracinaceae bacterium]|nr:hypothetical protein [Sandaracinaceae bacterium]
MHRTGPEVCDGVDNNCNLDVDEGVPLMRCCRDEDGDGYGVTSMSEMRCSCGGGWATLSGDCHDGNANVHPGIDWQAGTYWLPSSPSCFVGGPGSSADWNCDGTQERRYNGVLAFVCGSTSGGCARMVDWVDGSFPSCGVAESARICNEDCTVTTRVLPQECR